MHLGRDGRARQAADEELTDVATDRRRHRRHYRPNARVYDYRSVYNPCRSTSAPTRIDLAGGTIDIWPLYLFHPGAQTLNAAISLRARARIEPRDDSRIVIRSEDTGRDRRGRTTGRSCATSRELRLLSLHRHFFEAHSLTLTTSSESPAGAGIAGSSALNVAVCAALADWSRRHYEPEALLQIAMNIEAQAINVPTGLQDYRPALYGGIAALELEVDGIHRVPLDIDVAGARAAHRPVLHGRAAQLRHQQLGDHQEAHRRRPPRLRLLRAHPRHGGGDARGARRRATGTASARAIAEEWENRKRLAPGVTTPAIEELIARARAAGATAAKVCGAGGGGCLFCYGPPDRRDAIARGARRAAARGCSTTGSSATASTRG